MLICSTRLGDLDVPDDQMIHFSQGLLGFPEEKVFAFVPYQNDSPFAFLQSVDKPNLAFLVVDPFVYFKDYEFEFDDKLAQELEAGSADALQIINVVSLIDRPENMTANLLAPLVIHVQTRQAVQIVLDKSSYTTSHRLFPEGKSWQSIKEGR